VHRGPDRDRGALDAVVRRANAYLIGATTAQGIAPMTGDEALSSMIALKLCGGGAGLRAVASPSASLVRGQEQRGRYRLFRDPVGSAADTDATALAVSGLYESGRLAVPALVASAEQLLLAAATTRVPAAQNLDPATGASNGDLYTGVVMVHWEDGEAPRGRFHDAAAAANVLYTLKLAREMGLEDPRGILAATMGFVRDHLRSGAYLAGTRRYPSPDTFLYTVSRLCRRFTECRVELGLDLREALDARAEAAALSGAVDDPMSPLNAAQQVIAACHLGAVARVSELVEALAQCQDPDGSWLAAPFCALGDSREPLGSRAITTMFVALAVREVQRVARYEGDVAAMLARA
jgi:hypothetical protein